MTEMDWQNGKELQAILLFARKTLGDRKIRLYLCGGCRLISHLLYSPSSIEALDVVELYADDLASDKELHDAEWIAEAPSFGYEFEEEFWKDDPEMDRSTLRTLVALEALSPSVLTGGEWIVNESISRHLIIAARIVDRAAYVDLDMAISYVAREAEKVDWPSHRLQDCIFGNPFRPVMIDPSWMTSTVIDVANHIYIDRAFEEMPILADALQDAGCENEALIAHCRSEGPHVRGCWVVDLLTGKS